MSAEGVGQGTAHSREEVGRELDARVEAEVFGHRVARNDYGEPITVYDDGRFSPSRRATPRYSTDIAAAFVVVGAVLKTTGFRFQCGYGAGIDGVPRWWAFFGDPADASGSDPDTAPLAICRAALQAIAATAPNPRTHPDSPTPASPAAPGQEETR